MRMLTFFSSIIIFTSFFITPAFAQADLSVFMTPRDLLNNDAYSNINLQNNGSSTTTVYGLYVSQYAYVTPGQSCANAAVIYPKTNNVAAGAFVMPTVIKSGKKAVVGSNYLYNMIYQAIYYGNISSSPTTCALPGCSWGNDTSQYNWCIYLGALTPVSTSAGYTANVPPSAEAPSNLGVYNYNLISNYIYLGPISCNDRSLTCTTGNQQTQSFS